MVVKEGNKIVPVPTGVLKLLYKKVPIKDQVYNLF